MVAHLDQSGMDDESEQGQVDECVQDMHESHPSPGHKEHMQKHAVKELFGVI